MKYVFLFISLLWLVVSSSFTTPASADTPRTRILDGDNGRRLQGLLTTSSKGFVANVISPAAINAFAPEWMIWGWGDWLINYANHYGATKFAVMLGDQDPAFVFNAANIAAVTQHEAYSGWWILLREPSEWMPVQQAADIANAQMTAVLAVDPNAKFVLSVGTAANPVYKDGAYGQQLFALITKKGKVRAFGQTFYSAGNVPSIEKFVNKTDLWQEENYPAREVWLIEVGLLAGQPPEEPLTIQLIKDECAGGCERWAWYAFANRPNTPSAGYICLTDNAGQVTQIGEAWLE